MANRNSAPVIRLLSLDGGGVRGLSSLYLLRHTMNLMFDNCPPKPCEFFDMIGGTSTGGLAAIMLGVLEMSIQECIDAYIEMMDDVFYKVRGMVNPAFQLQGRFDTAELERAIKRAILCSGRPVDARLRTAATPRCKTYDMPFRDPNRLLRLMVLNSFVCSSSKEIDTDAVEFSNFRRRNDLDLELHENIKIWEAARATSAAPTYFADIQINPPFGPRFADGGVHYNNPVSKVYEIAHEVFGDPNTPPSLIDGRIQCFLSIGTGVPMLQKLGDNPVSLARTLVKIATDANKAATAFSKAHSDLEREHIYLRLNVQQGLQDVGLEDAQARALIARATSRYVADPKLATELAFFCAQARRGYSCLASLGHPSTQPSVSNESFFAAFDALLDQHDYQPRECWKRLTKPAYDQYVTIYNTMRGDSNSEEVSWLQIRNHFSRGIPRPIQVVKMWWKVGFPTNKPLLKAQVLALLFLLHLQAMKKPIHPEAKNHMLELSKDRRKVIENLDHWTLCKCQCRREWNFANDMGMVDESNCDPRKCLLKRYVELSWTRKIRDYRGAKLHDATSHAWLRRE